MKCEACGSETPPLYQHHSLAAWICHTCKSLGRMIEGLVVDSQPLVAEIEQPKPAEAPATSAQIVDQEPEQPAATEPENEDPTPTTPPGTNKKKTTKKL